MSCKEVTALRKSGRLEEALRMALEDFRLERDEYSASALFWVYRDISLHEFGRKNTERANAFFQKAKELSEEPELEFDEYVQDAIPKMMRMLAPNYDIVEQASEQSKNGDVQGAYDKMKELLSHSILDDSLHESYVWIIFRYLNDKYKELGSIPCRRLLFEYMKLHNERPSLLHSNILNLASKISESYSDFNFLEFIKLWDAGNFMSSDFWITEYQGKEVAPLTSRLMERCFKMGYGLEDVTKAFTVNSKIQETDILESFSKKWYFDIYRESVANGSGLLELFKSYCSAITGRTIQNQYHSKILKSMIWGLKQENKNDFLKLFDQWGAGNFTPSDWKKETTDDGKEYPSLAERAIAEYIEVLKATGRYSVASEEFENLLKEAINNIAENEQYKRHLAKLQFAKGKKEEACNLYKELLLSLNEYYIWGELSEIIEDKELSKSAICKALSCGASDDYLGNIHLRLAEILADEKDYAAAKTELQAYYYTYSSKQWRISDEYQRLLKSIPEGVVALESNNEMYELKKQLIEDYIYSTIEDTEFVVAESYHNNKNQQRFLLVNDSTSFSVNPKTYPELNHCHIGQTFLVKSYPSGNNGSQITPLTIRLANTSDWNPLSEKVGLVEYINESKQVYLVITDNSDQVFYRYEKQEYQIGDFIAFKQYKKDTKEGERIEIVCLRPIEKEEAVTHFRRRIIAVDDVNDKKQLFHFVFGPRLVSGIVHFDETTVRPSVGDCLEMYYCIRKNKEQKKIVVPLLITKTEEINQACVKSVSGRLTITDRADGSRFGFVDDYYVHNSILDKYGIESDCRVEAKIVYTGDGKWKVFELSVQ